jgi:hypothetical protein
MKIVVVKPKTENRVIDPKSMAPLPAEGKSVEFTKFWSRRVKDGSVEIVNKGSK